MDNGTVKTKKMKKKRNKFIIGAAFAAITFGGLYMTLGPHSHNGCCHKGDIEKSAQTEVQHER